jgi:hypothetical protein
MAQDNKQVEIASFKGLDADQLKDSVREMLVSMEPVERKLFIKTLQYEMFRSGLSIAAYLIPLGIPARCAEDLTPGEVGHLMRFFKLNVPAAVPALARVLDQCPVVATGLEQMTAWLLKARRPEARPEMTFDVEPGEYR